MSFVETAAPAQPPAYTLHPVHGVVWAAFWGTPLAAGIVMAINYSRAGNKSAAIIAASFGLLTTVVLFAVMFLTPEETLDKIPNAVFYIPQLVLVYALAKSFQAQMVNEHAAKGGTVASAWPAVGIGFLCMLVVLAGIFGVAYAIEPSYGEVVLVGKDEVYYTGEATEADARKLAGLLKDLGFFGDNGVSVKLDTTAGKSTVSYMLVDKAWEDAETVTAFKDMSTGLTSAFPPPLKIQLCDDQFVSRTSFTIAE